MILVQHQPRGELPPASALRLPLESDALRAVAWGGVGEEGCIVGGVLAVASRLSMVVPAREYCRAKRAKRAPLAPRGNRPRRGAVSNSRTWTGRTRT